MYLCILAKAGQTVGSNWLKFFEGAIEYPGGKKCLTNSNLFLNRNILKIPRATLDTSPSCKF